MMTDVLTPEQRHKAMKNIKNKETSIELKLRKALWAAGYRYRKNYNGLPGTPDIVFTRYKVAVFCDSEFFHGKDWNNLKLRLEKSSNSTYWIQKIERNMARDEKVNRELYSMGWKVIRFWGDDIKKDLDRCVKMVGMEILESIMEKG